MLNKFLFDNFLLDNNELIFHFVHLLLMKILDDSIQFQDKLYLIIFIEREREKKVSAFLKTNFNTYKQYVHMLEELLVHYNVVNKLDNWQVFQEDVEVLPLPYDAKKQNETVLNIVQFIWYVHPCNVSGCDFTRSDSLMKKKRIFKMKHICNQEKISYSHMYICIW